MKGGVIISVFVLLATIEAIIKPSQAFNCMDVTMNLVLCTSYLMGGAAHPAQACCNGVGQLKAMAVTTTDKRQVCACIKQAAARYQNIKDEASVALPEKCGAPLSFSISRNFDCNSIPRGLSSA